MRVVGVGGEPASGKSELILAVLPALGPPRPFAWRAVRGEVRGGVLVLGVYDGKPFPGTDRLSTTVQADAIRLLGGLVSLKAILFEGDRLFNATYMAACLAADPASRFLILDPGATELERRRAARPRLMSEPFLKGRRTKYRRIAAAYPPPACRVAPSGAVADLERNAADLLELLA